MSTSKQMAQAVYDDLRKTHPDLRDAEIEDGHPDEAPIVFQPVGLDGTLGVKCGAYRGEIYVLAADVFGDAVPPPALREVVPQLCVDGCPEPFFPLFAVLPFVDPDMCKVLETFRAASLQFLRDSRRAARLS